MGYQVNSYKVELGIAMKNDLDVSKKILQPIPLDQSIFQSSD